MANIEIRTEVREEGRDVVARLFDPNNTAPPIELGRVSAKLVRLHPDLFEAWKVYVKAAATAVIEYIARGIPGATVGGAVEVGPGERLIKPEERN